MFNKIKLVIKGYANYIRTPKGKYEWTSYIICLILILLLSTLGWYGVKFITNG